MWQKKRTLKEVIESNNNIFQTLHLFEWLAATSNLSLKISGALSLSRSHVNSENAFNSKSLTITSYFFTLYGHRSPLPDFITELLMNRHRMKDDILKLFIDIFNHRLILLLYKSHKLSRTHFLFDRNFSITRNTHSLSYDNNIFSYFYFFNETINCKEDLQRLLSDSFKLPFQIQEFIIHRVRIEPECLSRISSLYKAPFNQLGSATYLGEYFYTNQHKFDIIIGPIYWFDYKNIVLNKSFMRSLKKLIDKHAPTELIYDIKIQLFASDIPKFHLGDQLLLGKQIWLGSIKIATYDNLRTIPLH